MFNLTTVKITAANSGGYLIRPKMGGMIHCMIPSHRHRGELRLSHINVDIFNDAIAFVCEDGETYIMTGEEGTAVISRFLRATDSQYTISDAFN